MAITVTIGRNVGQSLDARPMDTSAWAVFRAEIVLAVRQAGLVVYFTGTGEGFSKEWGREDAFTVVAREPHFSDTRKRLYEELARVARYYGQEAVAVTEGTTEFV